MIARAVALACAVLATACGALDESAPDRPDPQACASVEDRLAPMLDLAAQGQLVHIADFLEHEVDPASQRALLRLLLDIGRAMPPGTLMKAPALLQDLESAGLVPLIVAILAPLPGAPDATPPVPAHKPEMEAFSAICRSCLGRELFVLLTDVLREPRLAPALHVLLGEAVSGAPQVRAALDAAGVEGRAGFTALVRNILTSLAQPASDSAPLLQTLAALIDPAKPGALGALHTLLEVLTLEPDGAPSVQHMSAVRELADCILRLDPDARIAGHGYDVLLAGVPLPAQLPEDATRTAEQMELLAYTTEVLASNQGSRDALGQVLGLVLRPDIAVAAIPELITLLQSDVLPSTFALVADLLLQPCRPAEMGPAHAQAGP